MTGVQVAAEGLPVSRVKPVSWSLPLYEDPLERDARKRKAIVSSCLAGAKASGRTFRCTLAWDQDATVVQDEREKAIPTPKRVTWRCRWPRQATPEERMEDLWYM